MSPEAINLAFVACLGYQPRAADLAMLNLLGTTAEAVADFIWDHHMGEPEEPTMEQVLEVCQQITEEVNGDA